VSTLKDLFAVGITMEAAREAKDEASAALRVVVAERCPEELAEYDRKVTLLKEAENTFVRIGMQGVENERETAHAMLHARGLGGVVMSDEKKDTLQVLTEAIEPASITISLPVNKTSVTIGSVRTPSGEVVRVWRDREQPPTLLSESYNNLVDRTGWLSGPWDNEPDLVYFNYAGFSCVLRRSLMYGAWCGYVGVLEDHPYYNQEYAEIGGLIVHGGVTFRGVISTRLSQGRRWLENLWMIGFDCAHYDDHSPVLGLKYGAGPECYRDIFYATDETKKLAEQLAKV